VLAVQCPLRTSLITQPSVRYIHTAQTGIRRRHSLYCASIASRDKNTSNSNLTEIYSTEKNQACSTSYHNKLICEELRSHSSRTEWTRPLRVLLAVNAHCRRVKSLSRRYATSTPKCHMLSIRYIALSDSHLPFKKIHIPVGGYPPRWEKNHPPAHPNHRPKRHNSHTTLNFYCY